jgi:DNA-binding MarR family transcriptional regulator
MTVPVFWWGVLAGGAGAVVVMGLFWWWTERRRERRTPPGGRPVPVLATARAGSAPVGATGAAGDSREIGPAPAVIARPDQPARRASERRQAGERPDEESLKISYRIVLHIARQGRIGPHELAPDTVTQAGMADALKVGRGALSNALRRLSDGGVLEVRTSHVRGQPTRRKVYQLTSEGEQLVRELRRRFKDGRDRSG